MIKKSDLPRFKIKIVDTNISYIKEPYFMVMAATYPLGPPITDIRFAVKLIKWLNDAHKEYEAQDYQDWANLHKKAT